MALLTCILNNLFKKLQSDPKNQFEQHCIYIVKLFIPLYIFELYLLSNASLCI